IELPVRAAPIVGIWAKPHPRVRAAATYRGELSLDLRLDILANVQVAGVVTGDALVSIRAANYYTPARATGGVDRGAAGVVPRHRRGARRRRVPPGRRAHRLGAARGLRVAAVAGAGAD